MLTLGLTGGIGSGKSTVAKVFETLGIPVYYSDIEAKRIMNEDESLRPGIVDLFGEDAYADGFLNRKYIASIVFKDKTKLDRLNAIVHPATIADAERWMKLQTTPYAIKEAAILFESGSNKLLDYIIGVSSPVELRVKRIMTRDSISEEEVRRRMMNQMPEEEKMKRCDFVIYNDDTQLLIPQVIALHEKLMDNV